MFPQCYLRLDRCHRTWPHSTRHTGGRLLSGARHSRSNETRQWPGTGAVASRWRNDSQCTVTAIAGRLGGHACGATGDGRTNGFGMHRSDLCLR